MKSFTLSLALIFTAVAANAQTLVWGGNSAGQLGLGNLEQYTTPQINNAVAGVTRVSGGGGHTLFLRSDGTVMSSGSNGNGQLGIGTVGFPHERLNPVSVINLTNVTQIVGTGNYSAALRSDGTVWVWGMGFSGQTGDGNALWSNPTPTQASISGVVQIEGGSSHVLALKADGTVWGWGFNGWGEIGIGAASGNILLPVQVGVGTAGFTNMIAVSAGTNTSMALKSDGTVWLWGRSQEGQIGNGVADIYQNTPVKNTTLTNISQIDAGNLHNVARRSDGTVWAWGMNNRGQVGNGTSGGNQLTPVQIATLSNVVEIAANNADHNLARLADGSVRAWGYNYVGQLGDGTVTYPGCECKSTPVVTGAGNNNALIAVGGGHSLALKAAVANVSVSGRVTTAGGRGVSNATVILTGSSGVPRQARTNPFGFYRFYSVPTGATYEVGVSAKRYQFTPRTINVIEELSAVDFIAN